MPVLPFFARIVKTSLVSSINWFMNLMNLLPSSQSNVRFSNPFPVVAICIGKKRTVKQLTCCVLTKQCDVFVYIYYSNTHTLLCTYAHAGAHTQAQRHIDVCVYFCVCVCVQICVTTCLHIVRKNC